MKKIINHSELPQLVTNLTQKSQPVVLVGGCFDILHLGHVRFLKQAKQHGIVIVALESDETLTKFKGKSRPIHRQSERAEVLSTLEVVDYVLLLPTYSADSDYFALIQELHPQVIAVTEGDPQLFNKQKQAAEVKAQIVIIPKITTPSTTQLIKLLQLDV